MATNALLLPVRTRMEGVMEGKKLGVMYMRIEEKKGKKNISLLV